MLIAARVTDNHVCPMVTGIVPHVGGPILPPCCLTVLIGGLAAARIGDMAFCVGPPDVLAKGAASVLIGGVPASRLTDLTAHGGVIVGPGALTTPGPTMIGDPAVTINIVPDAAHPTFAADVQAALAQILPTRSGAEWLRQMGANGQSITIVPFDGANGSCTPANGTNAANGVGTDSTIAWNPNHHVTDAGLPGAQGSPGAPVILGHEMVHALHNANGNNRNGPNDTFPGQVGSSARNEERSTVGTGGGPITTPTGPDPSPPDYSGDVPTENSFRNDLGIPPRPTYYPSTWPGGPPW